jgi:hypothetical protein
MYFGLHQLVVALVEEAKRRPEVAMDEDEAEVPSHSHMTHTRT